MQREREGKKNKEKVSTCDRENEAADFFLFPL